MQKPEFLKRLPYSINGLTAIAIVVPVILTVIGVLSQSPTVILVLTPFACVIGFWCGLRVFRLQHGK